MEGDQLKQGKERVRKNLIEPLERARMKRKAGWTVDQHQAMMSSLEARLAYMNAKNLQALAECCERHAGGKLKDVWPAEVSICNWARRLQEPPASESRLVRSYLQSGAGVAARAGDYLVELFVYLKRMGVPPNDYVLKELQQRAQDRARAHDRIKRGIASGAATSAERAQLDGYHATLRRCEGIIEAGKQGAEA
ncbi:hypothetical protein ACSQ76_12350 [Roseovarius sp. B08]|uniref:hypothetical protein n=1 Tax=Roseovarius sp. B08 TaxID=3449223 RepID=UPI003EDC1D44